MKSTKAVPKENDITRSCMLKDALKAFIVDEHEQGDFSEKLLCLTQARNEYVKL